MKSINDFSKEDFLKLTSEERLKLIRQESEAQNQKLLYFWKEEYPYLPTEEKIKIWAGGMYRAMREQGESGLNEYVIYSENWLRETLEQEPNFISMLPAIYNIWGGMFDSGKVDRIIQKLLKKIQEESL